MTISDNVPDLINASYEAFGFFAVAASCYRTIKDKKTNGISLITMIFFTTWGYWNLFYYPHLGQYISTVGAFATCVANTVWTYLIIKFRSNK